MTPQNVFIDFTNGSKICSPLSPACYWGTPITFTPATFGYSFSCGPHVFTWNFGDGTPPITVNVPNTFIYEYAERGTYTVTLQTEAGTYFRVVTFFPPRQRAARH